MRSNKIYMIYIVILISVSFVALVYAFSEQPNEQPNGFNRNYLQIIEVYKDIGVKNEISSIAGIYKSDIYLTSKDQKILVVIDTTMKRLRTDSQILIRNQKPPIQVILNKRHLWLISHDDNSLIQYDFQTGIEEKYKYDLNHSGIAGGDNIIVSKLFDVSSQKISLRSFNFLLQRSNYVDIKKSPANTIFSEIGHLSYDQHLNISVYSYYYHNGFSCFDSNLQFLSHHMTKDTFVPGNVNAVKKRLGSDSVYTVTTPPMKVNGLAFADNGVLFLQSYIKADNETASDFSDNITIDLYSIKSGEYKGSLRIPGHKKNGLKQFVVKKNSIIALYNNDHLRKYTIDITTYNDLFPEITSMSRKRSVSLTSNP